jgi:hypothetical protein
MGKTGNSKPLCQSNYGSAKFQRENGRNEIMPNFYGKRMQDEYEGSRGDDMVGIPEVENETVIKKDRDAETTRWQLSGLDLIEELRQRLLGRMMGNNGEYIEVGKRLCNDQGIGKIIWQVNSYINKNTQLSYYIPDEISRLMISFRKDLTDLLKNEWKDFEIDVRDLSIIHASVSNTVWSALNRARFGGEKEFLQHSEQRIVRRSDMIGGQQKEGFWSKLNPFH